MFEVQIKRATFVGKVGVKYNLIEVHTFKYYADAMAFYREYNEISAKTYEDGYEKAWSPEECESKSLTTILLEAFDSLRQSIVNHEERMQETSSLTNFRDNKLHCLGDYF